MDLRTRYRRSLLGLGWSLLQPLAMTGIFCLVFQQVMQVPVAEYVPHVLTGLVCWNFITACAVGGCQCFLQGESYIRQCPLPLAIYPLRTALGAMFHLSIGLCIVTAVCTAWLGFPGFAALASLLPTIFVLFIVGWSLAALGGTLNVFFQDTQHLAEVGFQILFYMTPIIYTLDQVQEHRLSWILKWNPVVSVMSLIRQPLLHGAPPTWSEYLHALGIAGVLAILASTFLARMQRRLIFYL